MIIFNSEYIKTDNYYITDIKSNYYLASNGAYKVQIYTDDTLTYGDVISIDEYDLKEPYLSLSTYGFNSDKYYRTSNIKYRSYNYKFIKHIPNISSFVISRIERIEDSKVVSLLKKQIFNITDYELLNDFIAESGLNYFGINQCLNLILAYFLPEKKKNRLIKIIFVLLFIINPCFQIFNYLLFRFLSAGLRNPYNSLGISALIILIIMPFKATSVSFLFPVLLRCYSLLKPSKTSITAFVILMNSYFFNTADILKTLLFRPLAVFNGFFTLLSLVFLPFSPICIILGKIYLFLTDLIMKFKFEIIGKAGLITFVLYFLLIEVFKRFKFRHIFIAMLVISLNINNIFMTVSFINIGHGDAILLKAPFNMETVLIDTGSKNNYYQLSEYLKGKGIYKIDYLLLTHKDEDHSGNAETLNSMVRNIIRDKNDIKGRYFSLIQLNKEQYDDVNTNSNCYYTEIGGNTYLFTGDIDKTAEKSIIKNYGNLDIDVLKVAHHGSKTSTSKEFIQKISPLLSIISCSNKYGFPDDSVINTLNNNKSRILLTKESGDIEIICLKFINIVRDSRNNYFILKRTHY